MACGMASHHHCYRLGMFSRADTALLPAELQRVLTQMRGLDEQAAFLQAEINAAVRVKIQKAAHKVLVRYMSTTVQQIFMAHVCVSDERGKSAWHSVSVAPPHGEAAGSWDAGATERHSEYDSRAASQAKTAAAHRSKRTNTAPLCNSGYSESDGALCDESQAKTAAAHRSKRTKTAPRPAQPLKLDEKLADDCRRVLALVADKVQWSRPGGSYFNLAYPGQFQSALREEV